MAETVSRWALLASVALHVGVIGLGLRRPPLSHATLSDFWAGSTFEVPDVPGDGDDEANPAAGSEIEVDGLDTSSAAPAAPIAPASPTANQSVPATTPAAPRARPAAGTTTSSMPSGERAAGGARGGATGAFGAEGSAPGVRDLVRSFVRTLPIVASSDPTWSSLPLGPAGAADFTIAVDDDGKPHAAKPLEPGVPAHVRRLLSKTLSVMSGGRFAVSGEAVGAEQRLRIIVSLTQQAPPSEDQVAVGGAFGLRFDPPDEHHVSHAFFTLASGRRVELAVRPLPSH